MTGGITDQEKTLESAIVPTEDDSGYARRPACFRSTVEECLFVLTATMAIGQTSFFQGSIVGITASIGRDLNMNSGEITWINAGASYACPLGHWLPLPLILSSNDLLTIHHTNHAIDSQVVPFY